MITNIALENLLDDLLKSREIKDYAPNGLQVEGKKEIKKIVTGVTATLPLIEAAISHKADAILVHHGYFWKNEDPCIRGMKGRRIKALIEHQINLFGYHLPLDIHSELGNNAQLVKLLGAENVKPMEDGSYSIPISAEFKEPIEAIALQQKLAKILGRNVILCDEFISGFEKKPIKTIGICSGGGQGYIDLAAKLGLDAFLSGEISEQTTHSAREQGIYYFGCGHHATERYGVKALGDYLAQEYQLEVIFVDVDNPA